MSRSPPLKPGSSVALVGMRGAGKSSVAPLLAARLGWPWLDLDAELTRQTGQSITELFAREGEAGFRAREAELLAATLIRPRQILATGGGVILRDDNRQRLRDAACVVYLHAEPATLWQRLQADPDPGQRPALTPLPGPDEVAAIFAHRDPLYRATADLIVDSADRTPAELSLELCERLAPWICTT